MRRLLHIVNGDSTACSLGPSGVPGAIASVGDVLHEGPTPAGVTPARWRRIRAEYHAQGGRWTLEDCLVKLRREDQALESFRDHDEVVLWFEHDLFDQLNLIRLLDWFSRRDLGSTKLSLVCIGEYEGIRRFVGLGQLTPAQLRPLLRTRRAVSAEQMALSRRAWRAFRSPDPTRIEAILASDTTALPFLAAALARHLEQFPSVQNGLSRTEREALAAVAAGRSSFRDLFPAIQAREEAPFMGDETFLRCLMRLAAGRSPLLTVKSAHDGDPITGAAFRLTASGRRVLDGKADLVRLNGIDRFLGGVHLLGSESPWRWDESRARLVATL